jgi:hypothetical protein
MRLTAAQRRQSGQSSHRHQHRAAQPIRHAVARAIGELRVWEKSLSNMIASGRRRPPARSTPGFAPTIATARAAVTHRLRRDRGVCSAAGWPTRSTIVRPSPGSRRRKYRLGGRTRRPNRGRLKQGPVVKSHIGERRAGIPPVRHVVAQIRWSSRNALARRRDMSIWRPSLSASARLPPSPTTTRSTKSRLTMWRRLTRTKRAGSSVTSS